MVAVAIFCAIVASGGLALAVEGDFGFGGGPSSLPPGTSTPPPASDPSHPSSAIVLPYVADTLDLTTNTLGTGNVLAPNDVQPVAVAYDSGRREIFVANAGSNDVSVINDSTKKVVANITVGSSPEGVAYDPGVGEVFVTNSGSDSVSVINDSSDAVVATVPVGAGPIGVAYDNLTGQLVVANSGSDNLSVINDSSDTIARTLAAGSGPQSVVYDSGVQAVYVAEYDSANVTAYNGTNDTLAANITVGFFPDALAYDSETAQVYVANSGSNNVSVINDTTDTVSASIGVRVLPDAVTYDSRKGEVFVADGGGANVTILNDSTEQVVTNLTVGFSPSGLAYDRGRGDVFVTNAASDSISVINDTTSKVAQTLTIGGAPYGVAYDSGTREVFVANYGTDKVNIISGATEKVVASVTVGSGPEAIAYDNGTSEVFVANELAGTVSVISDATNKVVATLPVGTYPVGLAYDRGKGEVFVANEVSGNVSVISDATDTVDASISVGAYPSAAAYDNRTGEIYVSHYLSQRLTVINDSTNHTVANVAVGLYTDAVTYDYGTSQVFAANAASDNVSVINGSTHAVAATVVVGSEPDGVGYDPSAGAVLVTNAGSNTTSVINDTTDSTGAPTAVGGFPVAVAYDSGSGLVYLSNFEQGTLSILSFVPPPTYNVTFSESGLTAGTSWTVTLGGTPVSTTNATIVFSEPNGTYAYSITLIPGWNEATLPYFGSVSVAGLPITEPTLAFSQVLYVVTFNETGLPGGTGWSVTLNGSLVNSTGSSIVFVEPNGTFAYAIGVVSGWNQTVVPYSGNVTVSGGPVTEPTLEFLRVVYAVTFGETGLPLGTNWSVTLNGTLEVTTNSSLAFAEPNGTYDYSISSVPGWYQTTLPYSGSVRVGGAPVSEPALAFAPAEYSVTFTESGLTSGTSWSVTLNGTLESSTGDSIAFTATNGTDNYSLTPVPGWNQATIPYNGSVSVDGASVSEPTIQFSQNTYNVTFTQTGLPSGTSWSITVNGTTESSTGTSITFLEPNGTADYVIGIVPGWEQSTLPTAGTLIVTGAPVTEPTLVFTAVTYTVTFAESGLPSGTSWSVSLNGTPEASTTTTITFSEANGTYSYSVGTVPGWEQRTLPSSGAVNVAGNAVIEPTLDFTRFDYTVTFSESGLPTGTSWSVTLNGTTHSSTGPVTFTVPNGTYAYSIGPVAGYTANRTSGSLGVDGAPVSEGVAFSASAPTEYSVTFRETGLPSGTSWSLTFNGTPYPPTSTDFSFTEANGTYPFSIGSVTGYTANVSAGEIAVNGAAVTEWIGFTVTGPPSYGVTFTETGLPSGTNWSVTLNGATESSTSSSITFTEASGAYLFSVGSVPGYSADPASGSVAVGQSAVAKTINFSAPSTAAAGVPLFDYVLVAIAVIVLVLVVTWLLLRQRGKPSSAAPSAPAPNGGSPPAEWSESSPTAEPPPAAP
ncbi:MAG: YncE family protein [Thermoplasmata archaeon]